MENSTKTIVSYLVIGAGLLCVAWLVWKNLPDRGPEPESLEALRADLENGETPEVRALAAIKLGERGDEESMPLLFKAMEDPDPNVRGRAAAAFRKITNSDYHFRADDPPEQRKAILATMKRDWEALHN